MMRRLWKRLTILLTGYDAEAQRQEFDAMLAAFRALPEPSENRHTPA